MRAVRALIGRSVDRLRARPAFRGSQDQQRPARAGVIAVLTRPPLDLGDLVEDLVESPRHASVHVGGLAAFEDARSVAIALKQAEQLVLVDARQKAGIRDLVAVEVQDRQHGAVGGRVEELVRVPTCGAGPGLGFAVADDAAGDQVGVVEDGAVGVQQAVSELAALVDRSGRFGRRMARHAIRPGELVEQLPETGDIEGDLGVELAVGAFEVGVGEDARTAVAGTGDVDHIEVALANHPVQVRVDEVQPRSRAPVSEQPRFDVLQLERPPQQRVVSEVNLPDRKVVRRPPIAVDLLEHLRRNLSGRRDDASTRRRFHVTLPRTGRARPFRLHLRRLCRPRPRGQAARNSRLLRFRFPFSPAKQS